MYGLKMISDCAEISALEKNWQWGKPSEISINCIGLPATQIDSKKYRIVALQERELSQSERIGRIILGTLALIFGAGLSWLSPDLRNLFDRKACRAFAMPVRKRLDSKMECLLAINTCHTKEEFQRLIKENLPFLDYNPSLFFSSNTALILFRAIARSKNISLVEEALRLLNKSKTPNGEFSEEGKKLMAVLLGFYIDNINYTFKGIAFKYYFRTMPSRDFRTLTITSMNSILQITKKILLGKPEIRKDLLREALQSLSDVLIFLQTHFKDKIPLNDEWSFYLNLHRPIIKLLIENGATIQWPMRTWRFIEPQLVKHRPILENYLNDIIAERNAFHFFTGRYDANSPLNRVSFPDDIMALIAKTFHSTIDR